MVTPAADAEIREAVPTANGGTGPRMVSGGLGENAGDTRRRALLRFELPGSIPSDATVTSVTVHVSTVYKLPRTPENSNFQWRRLLRPWTEAGATWSWPIGAASPWGAPGASAASDAAPPSASVAVSGLGRYEFASTPELVADVQAWLSDPAANHGWLLVSDTEAPYTARHFATRQDAANTPKLTIGFSAPQPMPPSVSISEPLDGTAMTTPANVTVQATASDTDGTVTSVQFFDGLTSLGTVTSAPYSVRADFYPGSHALTAVATDNSGLSTTSSVVTVTVNSVVIPDPIAGRIPEGDLAIEVQTIADGLAAPLGMAVPDDGSGRMFVYDQNGLVWVMLADGTRLATPLLDVRGRLVLQGAYDERGLLGLAVHPHFVQNPYVYSYTSEPTSGPADFATSLPAGATNNHQSVIAEWRIDAANSNAIEVTSRREILRIDQPQSNHNGGAMRFGPDGYLYVCLGDGGQANDLGNGHLPGGNAQSLDVILGKLIRLDVRGNNAANGRYGIPSDNPFVGAPGLDEIHAYGFRNPFSFSFDRGTGALYLGDVGQNKIEELNLVTKGGNYGWNVKEGSFWFDPTLGQTVTAPARPAPPELADPIAQYDHDDGLVVIAGFVYRGAKIPALAGRFVFGDWGSFNTPNGRLFYLDASNNIQEFRLGHEDRQLGLWIRGFGEDADGELYVFGSRLLGPTGATGKMLKIVPRSDPISLTSIAKVDDTTIATTWTGGTGPFAVQKKFSLADATWQNVVYSATRNATTIADTATGFFRVTDLATQHRVPFTAYLSGASSPATGTAIFGLEGNTLTFNIRYSGLSAAANNAHIHGPASTSESAGVLVNLQPYHVGAFGTSGSFTGTVTLTEAQRAILLAGKSYVNIHTPTVPTGEIRGQIAPVHMQVELASASNPDASGFGTLALVQHQLTLNVTYRGLSGAATKAHIHGPAAPGADAGVLVDLAPVNGGAFGASGSLSGTVTLTPAHLASVIDGLTSINFHTEAQPGGELRGQILPCATAVPFTVLMNGQAEKPSPVATSGVGAGTFALEGDVLSFSLNYSGLGGPATAAHIHGPANTGQSAGPLVNLVPYHVGPLDTAGTFAGRVTLTPDQRNAVLNGLAYVNVHTAANPSGEIRGQTAPVLMSASLSGTNERNTPANTPPTGSGTFASVRDTLTMNVTYANLLSAATASHIHGPATFFQNAGVLAGLDALNGGAYGTAGALSGSVTLITSNLLSVIDGSTYVNFHTPNYPAGEIRGQIVR